MANVNIGGDAADAHYRYKMPRLMTKVEGKGNGIKTILPNMVEVAKALHIDPAYPTKYFGCELGAQTRFIEKTGLAQVNGAHDQPIIADLLEKFIQKFVLCEKCNLPETELSLDSNKDVCATCSACGHHYVLEDQGHRLITFIIKSISEKSGLRKGGKKGQKKEKIEEVIGLEGPPASSQYSSTQIVKLAGEMQFLDVNTEVDDNEVDWSVDTSEDAAKRRQAEQVASFASKSLLGAIGADDIQAKGKEEKRDPEEELKEEAENLRIAIKGKEGDDVLKELRKLQKEKDYGNDDLAFVLFSCYYEAPYADIVNQLPKHAEIFNRLELNERQQRALLGAVERLCGEKDTTLLPKVPIILKLMYDLDMVEEVVILKWAGKTSKRYVDKKINRAVRAKATPFVEWLKQADEESD